MAHDDAFDDAFLFYLDCELIRDPLAPSPSDATFRVITIQSLLWDEEDDELIVSSQDDS